MPARTHGQGREGSVRPPCARTGGLSQGLRPLVTCKLKPVCVYLPFQNCQGPEESCQTSSARAL